MASVQVGTIFIRNRPLILRTLDLESEPYAENWDLLRSPLVGNLDQRIRGAGWNYFFVAAKLGTTVFGRVAAASVHKALRKIFARVRNADFNCLEVTKIIQHRFLGVSYIRVCAHSRHIQQGSMMDFAQEAASLEPIVLRSN